MKIKTYPLTDTEVLSMIKKPKFIEVASNKWKLVSFVKKGITDDVFDENTFWISYAFEKSEKTYSTSEMLSEMKKILSEDDFFFFMNLIARGAP